MARENRQKRHERRFGKAERLADIYGVPDEFVCFEATNVSDYYIAYMNDRPDKMVHPTEFAPCVALPFPKVFVEFHNHGLKRRVGWMMAEVRSDGPLALDAAAKTGITSFDRCIVGDCVFQLGDGRAVRPELHAILHTDSRGRMVENPAFNDNCRLALTGDGWMHMAMEAILPSLLAISFMNCKNVTLDPVDPPAVLNKIRQRGGLKPFLRYHTINIEPMKSVLRTEGGIEANGLKKALHICRGHFATYSDRMFGRSLAEPVTVWRPAHVRGSIKEGVVLSDYRVKAPTA